MCSSILELNMRHCRIGDHGLELLHQPFLANKRSPAPTIMRNKRCYSKVRWHFSGNNITCVSVKKLKCLFTSQFFPRTDLHLTHNFNSMTVDKYRVLNYLIECLFQKNCSLRFIDIGVSDFTEQHMYHLVLLLVYTLFFALHTYC